jgi:hypothetical protein
MSLHFYGAEEYNGADRSANNVSDIPQMDLKSFWDNYNAGVRYGLNEQGTIVVKAGAAILGLSDETNDLRHIHFTQPTMTQP